MLNTKDIYIEKEAIKYSIAKEILEKTNPDNIIEVDNYKDVFCRPRQNYLLQHKNQSIILAVKQKDFIYPGAQVCQNFGFENFYYSTTVMNCVCNCEYCFLKGMYPSGHIVVFVNLEDYFNQLQNKNVYVCVSYDTDLFPLENYIGYIKRWCEFAKQNKNICLEIRTKFKNLNVWNIEAPDNVYFAFSLSPQQIITNYEHGTSSLDARLEQIKKAQTNGFKTRLCFDPIIYTKNWEQIYSNLIKNVADKIDLNLINDVSIGSFRISQHYLKNMRKVDYASKIVNFPFKNINGYYQYNLTLQNKLENFVYKELSNYFDKERIFLWK